MVAVSSSLLRQARVSHAAAARFPSHLMLSRPGQPLAVTFRAFAANHQQVSVDDEDLPSNLVVDDLEALYDEPLPEFDEAQLRRVDNSVKAMPIIVISTPDYEDEDNDDTNESAAAVDADADEDTEAAGSDGDDAAAALVTKGEVVLDNRVFGVAIRRDIVQRVVVWQRARWRKGTAHTKTRAEVSGGGKKPWRQKGTGRARHGSIRSPLWRGGGKAHGKKKRDFSFKLNRKVRQMGMRVALAAKWREGNLFVVDVEGVDSRRTGEFVDALEAVSYTHLTLPTIYSV